MDGFIMSLHDKVFKSTVSLTKKDSGFASCYERWSDIDRKAPAVIAQPGTEHDVSILVRYH